MLIRSMLYHRKPLFWMFIALLTIAIAAGAWLLTRPPVQNAENPATPGPAPRDSGSAEPAIITLKLYQDGEYVQSTTVKDADKVQIVMDAIFNYMIKSAAWEAVDIDEQKDRIVIQGAFDTVFYVFDRERQHCMQSERDGRYAVISDEAYQPLYKLVIGSQQ